MHNTNKDWWGCTGKDGFPTRDKALLTIQRMGKSTQRRKGKIKVFKCDVCSQWHLGG